MAAKIINVTIGWNIKPKINKAVIIVAHSAAKRTKRIGFCKIKFFIKNLLLKM